MPRIIEAIPWDADVRYPAGGARSSITSHPSHPSHKSHLPASASLALPCPPAVRTNALSSKEPETMRAPLKSSQSQEAHQGAQQKAQQGAQPPARACAPCSCYLRISIFAALRILHIFVSLATALFRKYPFPFPK